VLNPVEEKAVRSRLYCLEEGDPNGKRILLIHGITGSHRYWNPLRKFLTDRYHLIIPDLIGFGHSPKPHIRYSVEIFRESIRNLILEKQLDQDPIIIIGHSLGAIIALEYAAAYGENVDRLLLFSLLSHRDEEAAHSLFFQGSPSYRNLLVSNTLQDNFSQIKGTGLNMSLLYLSKIPISVLIDSRKFTFRSLTSTLENCLLKYRTDQVFSRIKNIPIKAIHGGQDQVSPLKSILQLCDSVSSISLKIIENSGHHILLTHTDICLQEIQQFIEEKDPEDS
jgi:pimeloyl-ACP methyl ester carboxylesterase